MHNPLRTFDDGLHTYIVRGSHFIQRNFHLNRDLQTILCWIALLLEFSTRAWMEIRDTIAASGANLAQRLYVHSVLDTAIVIYLSWLAFRFTQRPNSYTRDPGLEEDRPHDHGHHRCLRQFASTMGTYALALLVVRYLSVALGQRALDGFHLKKTVVCIFWVTIMLLAHLVSSDQENSDKRTSLDASDV